MRRQIIAILLTFLAAIYLMAGFTFVIDWLYTPSIEKGLNAFAQNPALVEVIEIQLNLMLALLPLMLIGSLVLTFFAFRFQFNSKSLFVFIGGVMIPLAIYYVLLLFPALDEGSTHREQLVNDLARIPAGAVCGWLYWHLCIKEKKRQPNFDLYAIK